MFAALTSRLLRFIPAAVLAIALGWVFITQPFAQAETSLSQAQAQVAAARNLLSQAAAADQRADTLLASARNELERATRARDTAYRAASKASERDAAASAKADESEKAHTSARTWFTNATGAHNEALAAQEDARVSRDIAKNAQANATENLAALEAQVSSLADKKNRATSEVRSWTQKVEEARKSGASKQKIQARKAKLQYWRQQRDDAAAGLTQAKSARDTAAETLSRLTAALSDAETALSKATKTASSAKGQLDKAQANLNSRTTALTAARAAARAASTAHAQALSAYRGSDTAYDRAYDAVVAAVARKNETQDDRAQAQGDLDEATAILERARTATSNTATGSTRPDSTPATPETPATPDSGEGSVSTDQWLEQFTDIDISPEAKNDPTEPIVVPDLTVVDPAASPSPTDEPSPSTPAQPALPGGEPTSTDAPQELTPAPVDTVEFASSEAPDQPAGPSPLIIVIGVVLAVAAAVAWQLRPALLAGSGPRAKTPRAASGMSSARSRRLRRQDNTAQALHVTDDDPYALHETGGSAPHAAMQAAFADSFTGASPDSDIAPASGSSVFTPEGWGSGSVLDQDFTDTLSTPPSFGGGADSPSAPESTVTVLVRDSAANVLLFHNGFAWGPLSCPASTGSDPVVDAANLLRSVTGWAVGMGSDLDARILAVDGFSFVVEIQLPAGEHHTESGMWGTVEQVKEACPEQPWLVHLT